MNLDRTNRALTKHQYLIRCAWICTSKLGTQLLDGWQTQPKPNRNIIAKNKTKNSVFQSRRLIWRPWYRNPLTALICQQLCVWQDAACETISNWPPQSWVLSPLLLSLYPNSCPYTLSRSKCLLMTPPLMDSSVVWMSLPTGLRLTFWSLDAVKNNLELNALKTVVMIVGFRKSAGHTHAHHLWDFHFNQ